MKLTKNSKILLLCISTLVLIFSVFFAVIPHLEKANAEIFICDGEVKDTYSLNEVVVFKDVDVCMGDKTYKSTEQVLIYPDGRAYQLDEYTLYQSGQYRLVCSYENNTAQQTFKVFADRYSVESSLSSVEYVEDYALPGYKLPNNINKEGNEVIIPESPNRVTGLKVSLSEGDRLLFNEPIKLEDGLESIIKIFPLQDGYIGTNEYKRAYAQLNVTLTDCYDDSNKITFVLDFDDEHWSSIDYRVGVNSSREVGLQMNNQNPISEAHKKNRKEVFIDGVRCVAFYDYYGTYSNFRLTQKGYEFLYNLDTEEVYVKNEKDTLLVSVLSNADIYGENIFNGFTTGEVYLSINASGNVDNNNATFIISDVLGIENSDLQSGGESISYRDTTSPKFEFDVPDSVFVTKGATVPVFAYRCFDVNLMAAPKVELYYNYGTVNQVQLSLTGGKFIAKLAGTYSLVYTAQDKFGNEKKEIIVIYSIETETETIDFTIKELDSVIAGKQFSVPDAENVSSLNGTVTCAKKIEYLDGEPFKPIEMDDSGNVTLYNLGRYKIIYTFTDGIFTNEYSYIVMSVPSETVKFIDNPVMPSYFMKGQTYSLDKFVAYSFTEKEPVEIFPTVEMKKDGDIYRVVNSEEVLIDAANTVQFRFTIGEVSVESNIIRVVDCGTPNNLKIEGYFQSDDCAVEYNSSAKRVELVSSIDGASAEFINPLSLTKLNIEFGVVKGKENFTKITFVVVDYYDASNILEISYLKKSLAGKERYFLVTNEEEVEIDNFYSGGRILEFVGNDTLRDNQMTSVSVSNLIRSFSGDKIRLSIKLEGVTGESGIYFSFINSQTMSAIRDLVKPIIVAPDYNGYYRKGEKIVVGIPEVTDVLSAVLVKNILISVELPNGTYATSSDGIVLESCLADREYEIELNEYGEYKIIYTATDAAKRTIELRFNPTVTDCIAPEFSFEEGFDSTAIQRVALGAQVTIAGYTVTDDVSEQSNISVAVSVLGPQGEVLFLDGNAFNANVSGYYRVTYICRDEGGNTVIKSYIVFAG